MITDWVNYGGNAGFELANYKNFHVLIGIKFKLIFYKVIGFSI